MSEMLEVQPLESSHSDSKAKILQFFSKFNRKKIVNILSIFVIALVLPVTVLLVNTQTSIRSKASEIPSIETQNGIPSGGATVVDEQQTSDNIGYVQFGSASPRICSRCSKIKGCAWGTFQTNDDPSIACANAEPIPNTEVKYADGKQYGCQPVADAKENGFCR